MANTDNISLDLLRNQVSALNAENKRLLQSGDGGGTFNDMEARVARLEEDGKDLRSDVKAIRIDLAEIKGKLSNMPSTWQMIGLMVTLLGLAFVILKFAAPGSP